MDLGLETEGAEGWGQDRNLFLMPEQGQCHSLLLNCQETKKMEGEIPGQEVATNE